MLGFKVETSGPFFDGRTERSVRARTEEAKQAVGEAGVNLVRAQLSQVLRNPTGFYRSQVRTDRTALGPEVTDGGVVYGPWLEGTSSRNASSRFKGYATFRRMSRKLQLAAVSIARPIIDRGLR